MGDIEDEDEELLDLIGNEPVREMCYQLVCTVLIL